jgi:hypothetical protein
LGINVGNGANAQLIVKGNVTLNSNNRYHGMYSYLEANTKLEIDVENGSTLESCGNSQSDIYGEVEASATATFSGTGYTCSSKQFIVFGGGTVVPPNCQDCS